MAGQKNDEAGRGEGCDEDAYRDVHLKRKCECDANERRVRDGLAEIGHAAPNDHGPQRGGHNRERKARGQGPPEERIDHEDSSGAGPEASVNSPVKS